MDVDKFVRFRSPFDILESEPCLFAAEITFFTIFLLTFVHAMRSELRIRMLWYGTFLYGIVCECISYFVPFIDNFWHGQSSVMFIGGRLPLYIVCFYPSFYYTSCIVAMRSGLPKLAQPFVAGLCALFMDLPLDTVAVKMVWWTWHDTEPNIADRFYSAPVTSFFFNLNFTCVFLAIFTWCENSRCCAGKGNAKKSAFGYINCSLLAALCTFPLGSMFFIPFYHIGHDLYQISAMVCLLSEVAVFVLIISACGSEGGSKRLLGGQYSSLFSDNIFLAICVHFVMMFSMVVMFDPSDIQSAPSIRQPVGNCEEMIAVVSPTGKVFLKGKYLCAENFDEHYFDFSCLSSIPSNTDWYGVCGTAHPNFEEFLLLIGSLSLIGIFGFWKLLRDNPRKKKKKKKQ